MARALPTALLVPCAIALLAGWLLRGILQERVLPLGNVLTALATLSAAWWIQRALRRQAELDRIPIEGVGKASERIAELTDLCLDTSLETTTTDATLLYRIRLISLEITWLKTLVTTVGTGFSEYDQLQRAYMGFKGGLTGGAAPDLAQAGRFGMVMRTHCLQIRWKVAKAVMDNTSAGFTPPGIEP